MLAYETQKKIGFATKNLCRLPTPFYLAKKVGEMLGRSAVLQRQM